MFSLYIYIHAWHWTDYKSSVDHIMDNALLSMIILLLSCVIVFDSVGFLTERFSVIEMVVTQLWH